jgi:hypothetical protein
MIPRVVAASSAEAKVQKSMVAGSIFNIGIVFII